MTTPSPQTHPEFYDGVLTKRLLAWVIDTVLIFLICIVIVPFTGFIAVFFFAFLWLLVSFVYRVATLATGSATWGMRLVAIELRDSHDRPLDGGTALMHTLGYSVSIAVAPLQAISIILMVTSATGQGLTDMILGTVAMNKRRKY